MRNPWLKKNPVLSMWLSAANATAVKARGQATAVAKREASRAVSEVTQAAMTFWFGGISAATKPRRAWRKPKP